MPGFTPRHENEIRWFPSSCLGTDAHEAHSGALVDAMLRMLPSPGALIPDELMKALHECGLAVRTKDSEKESTDPPAAGEMSASSDLPVVNIAMFLTSRLVSAE
jgi:hypothetical protein